MHYYDLGCNQDGEIVFVIRSPEGGPMALVTKLGEFERAKADAEVIVDALNAYKPVKKVAASANAV
jgi:hypothetical protein